MRPNLYGRYDEQVDAAKRLGQALRHRMMDCLRLLGKELQPVAKAAVELRLAKISFELSRLDGVVKGTSHLQSADQGASKALAYYKSISDAGTVRNELADCYATLARVKIVQGSPYSAEVDLRDAIAVLRTGISATDGDLRSNLQAAAAELAGEYISAGQIARARELFDLF